MRNDNSKIIRLAIIGFFVVVILAVVASVGSQFFYLFTRIEQDEVGVMFRSGSIYRIVGPGVYSDFGLFVEMKRVSSKAVPFSVRDEEIITADKQRIGVVVTGDAFRPGTTKFDILQTKWSQYSAIFLDDIVAGERVKALAQQSMKVCVGTRKFDEAIIGTARDALRQCIDDELSKLAENYGLQIENVVVPEVILSPEVQAALDSIVASRLATEKAAQDKLKADAEAAAEQARQEGQIRVEQSAIQEKARQETTLAVLEQEKLIAQRSVIEAQKANDLFSAQQDLEINKALAAAAAEKAKQDLALESAKAKLYGESPEYVQLLIVEANASALRSTDKIIFVQEGMTPTLVLPGPGIVPTVDTGYVQPE